MSVDRDRSGPPEALDAVLADVIPALAARLRASRLAELEVRTGEWRVRVRREVDPDPPAPRAAPARHGVHIRAATPDIGGGVDQPGVARSPGVGYYMPGSAAQVGRTVRNGDVLGQVEMLGIFLDVPSPVDGIVIRSLAVAGEAVEYGQPLVLVETGGSSRAEPAGRDMAGAAKDEPALAATRPDPPAALLDPGPD